MDIAASHKIRVGPAPRKGFGVFAVTSIRQGEIIEQCPVLLFKEGEQALCIDRTPLECYYYRWNEDTNALLLGFGSLYNHSYSPNAVYERNYTELLMEFRALRDIMAGEEILVNYNGRPDSLDQLWFECA